MMNPCARTQLASAFAFAIAAACGTGAARADVLNFDDLPATTAFFLSPYHGFTFGTDAIATSAWFYTNDVNDYYGPQSGANYVSTDYQLYSGAPFEATQAISSATPFRFDGAWFSGGDQVRFQLYSGATLVFTSADSAVIPTAPIWVPSGYNGLVTSVVIVGRQGFYAMDDFTYNSPVPEPTPFGLIGAGLLALGAVVSRRRAR